MTTTDLTDGDLWRLAERMNADPYLTWKDIAHELGIKYGTLHKAIRTRIGLDAVTVPRKRRIEQPDWFETAESMFVQGWPIRRIAERVQAHHQTVAKHLTEAGYDTMSNRTPPEPPWLQEAIRLLDEELMSVEQAARAVNTTPGRLRALARRRGWSRHTHVATLRAERPLEPKLQRYHDAFTHRVVNWRGHDRMTDFLDRMIIVCGLRSPKIDWHEYAMTRVARRHHVNGSAGTPTFLGQRGVARA